MWLDNLKEARKRTGMSNKQIADKTFLTEKTISRILSGDTSSPRVDSLRLIASALDTSLDEIFAESRAVVGGEDLKELQEQVDRLTTERDMLLAARDILTTENAVLREKITVLTAEGDLLRLKLEHKEEIIALHNYYIKMRPIE